MQAANQILLLVVLMLLGLASVTEQASSKLTFLGVKQPITEADAHSGTFLNSVAEATRQFNMHSNSMMHHAMLRYENATKQLVAGIRYDFTAIFVETSCRKQPRSYGQPLSWCSRKLQKSARAYSCPVTVVFQPWQQHKYSLRRRGLRQCRRVRRLQRQQLQHRVLLGADSHDVGHIGQFKLFKETFRRVYRTKVEEQQRYKIFRENMKRARAYQLLDLGSATYGVTQFADLTEEEFRSRYLTPRWDLSRRPRMDSMLSVEALPESFDWREKGAVSVVKNQGSCGSCWAFSTTGNIEGQWFLKKKRLLDLSEQELVDCDKVDQGCNGGLPSQAYKEIQRLGGLMSESKYPYSGRGESCKFDKSRAIAYVNGSLSISKDEKQMAAWLVKNGPISIGINANAMQFYLGGVSHPWKIFCNPSHLDHGVLIVGYGKKGEEPYWIVKNSWGPTWGLKGYYEVYRGDGTCGLNQMCTSAVVK